MKRLLLTFFSLILFVCSVGATSDLRLRTVVIDPGHGGKDPGAVSKDRKTYEKSLTLDLGIMLADKIRKAYPDVKVVMTRTSDKFVSLNERAELANREDAQLFISIHINSAKSTKPNGYSVHTLGQSSKKDRDLFAYNMDVCKRENSVILLEDDYNTKYQGFDPSDPESFIFMQLMQNSFLEQSIDFSNTISEKLSDSPIKANRGIWQDPFYVLWKTSMPSVLVELGFISNDSDLEKLRKPACRDAIADKLFKSFADYKSSYDESVNIDVVKTGTVPEQTEESVPEIQYGVQIFATGRDLGPNDPAFLGYRMMKVQVGSVKKYVISVEKNINSVKKNFESIKKKYPDSFMVKIDENSNLERVR